MECIRQVLAVSGVMLLLAGFLWFARRKGTSLRGWRTPRGRTLQAIERLSLSPQVSLHLVRLGERGWLVSASASGCSVLDSFEWSGREKTRAAGGIS